MRFYSSAPVFSVFMGLWRCEQFLPAAVDFTMSFLRKGIVSSLTLSQDSWVFVRSSIWQSNKKNYQCRGLFQTPGTQLLTSADRGSSEPQIYVRSCLSGPRDSEGRQQPWRSLHFLNFSWICDVILWTRGSSKETWGRTPTLGDTWHRAQTDYRTSHTDLRALQTSLRVWHISRRVFKTNHRAPQTSPRLGSVLRGMMSLGTRVICKKGKPRHCEEHMLCFVQHLK